MDDEILGRDDTIAWACYKLSRLSPGLRMVNLLDLEGQLTGGRMLVHIRKNIRSM